MSGYISIVSSKDLTVKGVAYVNCPVLELSFQSGLLVAIKADGSIAIFKSNVRPLDDSSRIILDNFALRQLPDLKEIIPLYEYAPSLNGDPAHSLPEDGRFTSCAILKGRSAFEHTTIAGIDDGRLMYLTCEIPGEANQRYMARQPEILHVDLSPPSHTHSPRHFDQFKVVFNKKPLHGESRVISVLKATNKLVMSIDSTGFMFVQLESRKVISVGQIILTYKRYRLS
jgi:hypothetical protein